MYIMYYEKITHKIHTTFKSHRPIYQQIFFKYPTAISWDKGNLPNHHSIFSLFKTLSSEGSMERGNFYKLLMLVTRHLFTEDY